MKLYVVVDKRAKALVAVFQSLNDETAERSFLMLLTGPQNIYTDFPEDFAVYSVADLSVDGCAVVVARPGSESLAAHGFKCESFFVNEPLKEGSDYDKRFLSMVRSDRFAEYADKKSEEDSVDD